MFLFDEKNVGEFFGLVIIWIIPWPQAVRDFELA